MPLCTPTIGKRKAYCGPWAVAAVTGRSCDQIIRLIEKRRGRDAYTINGNPKGVRGTHCHELTRALDDLGIAYQYRRLGLSVRYCPTVSQHARALRAAGDNRARIICIRDHWMAMTGLHICDSHNPKVRPIKGAKKARARAEYEIIVQ